jgi:pimeloyl-ACP methyl ester carboxylesterase
MGWFNEQQRVSASPENAVKLQRTLSRLDVRDLLHQVETPTLVFHSREDQAVPFSQGEELAAGIPGAHFVPLESKNHILLPSEPAWAMFTKISGDFLSSETPPDSALQNARASAPEDTIHFITASDGTKLAYAEAGEGFPLVKAQSWMAHLELDPVSHAHGHWVKECARRNRFIRSDMRGFGLSEWEPPNLDFEHMVSDLEAVIDAAGVETCDLLGLTHGGTIAMAYAARHPERVRKLVLVNAFAAGWRVRADPEEIAWRESLLEMNRSRPSFRRSLLGEMFITLYYPSATQELIDWHNENFRKLGPAENMEPVIDLVSRIDIRDELAKIRAPTLIFHCRLDGNVPLVAGRQVADGIAGARLVELDSANHFVLADEPAWPVITREMRAFLASD